MWSNSPTTNASLSPSSSHAAGLSVNNGTLPDHCVEIETVTWSRDSHDLFDYEAQHMNKRTYRVMRHGKIYRIGEDVEITQVWNGLPENSDYLCQIRFKDGRFVILPADRSAQQKDTCVSPKKLWLIVRDIPGGKYALQRNDIVKLGRFKIRVRQLIEGGEPVYPDVNIEESEVELQPLAAEESKTTQCRICLLEGGSDEDPLICPCVCRGSIQYVHVDCLRKWVSGKLNITTSDSETFFYKSVNCELCKTTFPSHVNIGGDRVPVARIPKMRPPFIVFENVVSQSCKGMYVCSMADLKDLKLGRGHESDVRIPDVSISRFHATVKFAQNNFYLEDHQSKFGTLVAMRKPFFIDKAHNLSLQAGRTVLVVSTKKIDTESVQSADSAAIIRMPEPPSAPEEPVHDTGGGTVINEAGGAEGAPGALPRSTQLNPQIVPSFVDMLVNMASRQQADQTMDGSSPLVSQQGLEPTVSPQLIEELMRRASGNAGNASNRALQYLEMLAQLQDRMMSSVPTPLSQGTPVAQVQAFSPSPHVDAQQQSPLAPHRPSDTLPAAVAPAVAMPAMPVSPPHQSPLSPFVQPPSSWIPRQQAGSLGPQAPNVINNTAPANPHVYQPAPPVGSILKSPQEQEINPFGPNAINPLLAAQHSPLLYFPYPPSSGTPAPEGVPEDAGPPAGSEQPRGGVSPNNNQLLWDTYYTPDQSLQR